MSMLMFKVQWVILLFFTGFVSALSFGDCLPSGVVKYEAVRKIKDFGTCSAQALVASEELALKVIEMTLKSVEESELKYRRDRPEGLEALGSLVLKHGYLAELANARAILALVRTELNKQ